jgi:hypothetical protein
MGVPHPIVVVVTAEPELDVLELNVLELELFDLPGLSELEVDPLRPVELEWLGNDDELEVPPSLTAPASLPLLELEFTLLDLEIPLALELELVALKLLGLELPTPPSNSSVL